MKTIKIILRLSIYMFFLPVIAEGQNVGINTLTPERTLEVEGNQDQFARIRTTNNSTAESAIELIIGANNSAERDYKITNHGGLFKIITNTDNFQSFGDELWRIDHLGRTGLGGLPASKLHILSGEEGSNTGDGYLLIGTKTAANMVLDPNEILARNNGNANPLYIQLENGNTHIGDGGGNTYVGGSSGNLGIGASTASNRLSIDQDDFQIHLSNTNGTPNDWYIGASNGSWSAGDNQLLFSPNSTSDAAVLRLMDVVENGGTVAPVTIRSSASQSLLLDGNEIDTKSGPLYINHNSDQETYINPSGGRMGIGNDDPSSTVHVTTQEDEHALRLEKSGVAWSLNPVPAFDYLGFIKDGWTVGHADGASGQWITISDRRLKKDIEVMHDVLEKISQVNTYTYSFKHDPEHHRQIGIIAQEIAPLWPELVDHHNGQYSVAYSKLSVILLKALQEQQQEIEALENELTTILALSSPVEVAKPNTQGVK